MSDGGTSMAQREADTVDSTWPPIPVPKLLGGAASAALLGVVLAFFGDHVAALWLLLPALLVAAGAIVLVPRSPLIVAAGAALTLVAYWSFDPAWDSARMVLKVLTWIGFIAAVLLALPECLGRAFVYLQ